MSEFGVVKDEDLEPIDYLDYITDAVRISHALPQLSTEALKLEPPLNRREENLVRKEIRKRKKRLAGLHIECVELESLLNR